MATLHPVSASLGFPNVEILEPLLLLVCGLGAPNEIGGRCLSSRPVSSWKGSKCRWEVFFSGNCLQRLSLF